jgi:signal transduction histidine kinase
MSISLRVKAEPPTSVVSLARKAQPAQRGIELAALRAPLLLKLVGANVVLAATLLGLGVWLGVHFTSLMIVLAIVVLAVHTGVVFVALQPIRELESVAMRVWRGDYGARVTESSVADNEVLRVGSMFNILLDALAADRARMRALARDVIASGDRERSALARELQDSAAQHVAALLYELAAVARDTRDPVLRDRLEAARDSAEAILEEIRGLSQTMHSGVLEDLGLPAALKRLAREAGNGNAIDFDVDADAGASRLPHNVEGALFRVAQEAVYNATRHASPRRIQIQLHARASDIVLRVHDDGRGFRVADVIDRPTSRGLTSMRERLSLVDGTLAVDSAPNNGTTVTATVPVPRG